MATNAKVITDAGRINASQSDFENQPRQSDKKNRDTSAHRRSSKGDARAKVKRGTCSERFVDFEVFCIAIMEGGHSALKDVDDSFVDYRILNGT